MVERLNPQHTIMVVDDTDDVREIVRLKLLMLGYQIIEATNGLQAVEVVRRKCPDLIFMDIHMPQLNGLEATRVIRGIKEACDVPIVAFSAFSDNRDQALAAGCTEFVSKTDMFGRLESLLDQYLITA